ncbi:MAG TPA: LUD domain-containing protein [Acidobacteriota bacterium]|nr:LUD domain-containing protein [Acidobacteriota bacterium]
MDARRQILDRIREALKHSSGLDAEPPPDDGASAAARAIIGLEDDIAAKIERFKNELTAVSGEFVEVRDGNEAVDAIAELLLEASLRKAAVSGGRIVLRIADKLAGRGITIVRPEEYEDEARARAVAEIPVGIVEATFGVADSGTVAVPFTGRSTFPCFLPEIAIVLVFARSVLKDHFELFKRLSPDERRNLLLITGPSRTADIEKILTLGAHGPRRLIVVLVQEAD